LPARLIGTPRNSPTYGLPTLSSSCTGAHSPENSIWANAGTVVSVIASRASSTTAPAIGRLLSPPIALSRGTGTVRGPGGVTLNIPHHLEHVLDGQLHDSGVGTERDRRNLTKGRAVEGRRRQPPVEPIEDVEGLDSNLDVLTIRQSENPRQRHVHV